MPYYGETLVFLAGGACLAVLYTPSVRSAPLLRGLKAGAAVAVAVMAVVYFNSWLTQKPERWLHLHDFYHYYVGAKYYREVGHMRLYLCTHAALDELEREGHDVPLVTFSRSLDRPSEVNDGPALDAKAAQCRDSFDAARWARFKGDLAVLLAHDASDQTWRPMLNDLGNNSPPGWNVAASFVANRVPLNADALIWLPLIDQILLVVVLPLVLYRAFGFVPTLAYLLFYFANPLANLGWTGGSYFRADWYAALAGSVIALAVKRFALAGFLLAIAVVCRAFPVVFALGAVLVLALGKPELRSGLLRLCTAGAVGGIAFGALSLAMFGPAVWYEFVEVLQLRINPYGNNSIGLLKVASFWNVLVWPSFEGAGDALNAMTAWLAAVRHDAASFGPLREFLGLALLVSAVLAVRGRDPMAATVVLGSVAVFTVFSPFIYYYVFLALLPLAAWRIERETRASFMAVLVLGMASLRVVSIPFQRELGYEPSYFTISFQTSRVMLAILACSVVVLAWFALKKAVNPATARWNGVALVLALAVMAGAAVAYRPAPHDQTNFHALDGFGRLSTGGGVHVVRRPATASWPGSRYLEIEFNAPAQWLRAPLTGIAPGSYRVDVASTGADFYGDFSVILDDKRHSIEHGSVRAGTVSPRLTSIGEVRIGVDSFIQFESLASSPANVPQRIGVSGVFLHPLSNVHP